MYRYLHNSGLKAIYSGLVDISPVAFAFISEVVKFYNEIAGNISVTLSIIYSAFLIHEKIKNNKKQNRKK